MDCIKSLVLKFQSSLKVILLRNMCSAFCLKMAMGMTEEVRRGWFLKREGNLLVPSGLRKSPTRLWRTQLHFLIIHTSLLSSSVSSRICGMLESEIFCPVAILEDLMGSSIRLTHLYTTGRLSEPNGIRASSLQTPLSYPVSRKM